MSSPNSFQAQRPPPGPYTHHLLPGSSTGLGEQRRARSLHWQHSRRRQRKLLMDVGVDALGHAGCHEGRLGRLPAEATAEASEWNPCDNVLGRRGVQRGVVQLYCFDGFWRRGTKACVRVATHLHRGPEAPSLTESPKTPRFCRLQAPGSCSSIASTPRGTASDALGRAGRWWWWSL